MPTWVESASYAGHGTPTVRIGHATLRCRRPTMNSSSVVGPLPIFVLAGVLGSGKTTLMTQLAQHAIAHGHRVGMVVNDIGDLGVDAVLLAETGWPHAAVDSLNGKCACCSDSTDIEAVIL